MRQPVVFLPDHAHYLGLPETNLLLNPLIDISPDHKERSEMEEFYKLSNEHYSPEFGIKYLLNTKLYPFQMSIVRAILQHQFPMILMTRGGGKTFILAVYAVLHAILYPGTKIVLISAGFRQAKNIFKEIKVIYKNSPLLRAISDRAPHDTVDRCEYMLGTGSSIVALPLGQGDKIRGERGHVILVDEFNSVPLEVFDIVVRGFAATEADPWHKTKSLLLEKKGDKIMLPSLSQGNKIILAGTAGYKNGTLYRMYSFYRKLLVHKMKGFAEDYKDILGDTVDDEQEVDYRDYCILRLKYNDRALRGMLSEKIINNARATMTKVHFAMEYETEFADDTQGFFKARDIVNATCKQRDSNPFSITMKGKSNRVYIMGVDPARTSDRFAISVIEIGSPNKLVYVWTCDNKPYSYATQQIRRILRRFKVLGISMDMGGGGFAVEELLLSKDLMEQGDTPIYRFDNEDPNIPSEQKILHMFNFSSAWIDESNALLQKNIEDKVLMFPLEITSDVSDDADDILTNIIELKKELTSIEVTYTKTGKKHFDLMPAEGNVTPGELPKHKDRYSSLLLGNFLTTRFSQLTVNEDEKIREAYKKKSSIGGYLEDF